MENWSSPLPLRGFRVFQRMSCKVGGFVELAYQYSYKGKLCRSFPDDIEYSKVLPKPCYTKIEDGWKIAPNTKNYDDLPPKAKEFITLIEAYTGVPVKYIGIGPKNEDMIIRGNHENTDIYENLLRNSEK